MNEVYIDGVNVAECKFFQSKYLEDNSIFCEFCTMSYNACLNNPDCYFKQLQRAKAEKQDLINYYELREGGMLEDIQYWKNKAQEFYKELEQYKKSKQASYESMQTEWNNAVNKLRDVQTENERLKCRIEGLEKCEDIFFQENEDNKKYIQALEDIKEIANEPCIEDEDCETCDTNCMSKEIINIINEVLNE